jgi:hypothetical protein
MTNPSRVPSVDLSPKTILPSNTTTRFLPLMNRPSLKASSGLGPTMVSSISLAMAERTGRTLPRRVSPTSYASTVLPRRPSTLGQPTSPPPCIYPTTSARFSTRRPTMARHGRRSSTGFPPTTLPAPSVLTPGRRDCLSPERKRTCTSPTTMAISGCRSS